MWLGQQVLTLLLNLIERTVTARIARIEEDRERDRVDLNVKKYEEAKDRAERTKAALDLLNRNKP